MESILTPRPVPPDRDLIDRRKRYDWEKVVIDEWQNWLEDDPSAPVTDAEARRRAQNLVVAAREWAGRNGLRVQTRRVDHGRTLDLLFTRTGA